LRRLLILFEQRIANVGSLFKRGNTGRAGTVNSTPPVPLLTNCKTKEIPHRADHHPCVLFPVAFTTTNLNSNT
ncbi:hypothetical protein ACODQQ_17420, partial [Enterobacter quasiroggenkampii]|uniref:hypothetical protein n=1 Tax=Enterobacter quasiroggenkampii TaxID=2497436 RepID=UPI003B00645C